MSLLSRFNKNKQTNFDAGGLRLTFHPKSKDYLGATEHFRAPRKLDFRDMCIKTSNQFSTPHCAGFATAGMIEVNNWQKKHYPKQIDGDNIYYMAKEFDKDTGSGTSLESAGKAAIELGLASGELKFISSNPEDIRFTIHTNMVFVAGFRITNEWNLVNKKTGVINKFDKPQDLGGHAVLVCGYDSHGVYIQNSWGTTWGLYGFALIPWEQVDTQFMYGMIII